MKFGNLFERSLRIVWENKYLILLGILASLGGGSSSSFSGGGGGGGGGGQPTTEPGQIPDFGAEIQGVIESIGAVEWGIIIALICVGLLIGLVFWVVSTVARGGLVSGVDTIESAGKSSFSTAWRAAWGRVLSLLGISILPAIPALALVAVGLIIAFTSGAFTGQITEGGFSPEGAPLAAILLVLLACALVPMLLLLSALRIFAERACMLEGLGALDAYRRGWQVMIGNLGDVIILFILQVVVSIGLGLLLFLPGLILALCCFLWPLLLAVQGFVSAFFSSLWTLAWREWTGKAALVEKEPQPL